MYIEREREMLQENYFKFSCSVNKKIISQNTLLILKNYSILLKKLLLLILQKSLL